MTGTCIETLADLRRSDAERCGNKAASLGELSFLGFRVPPAVVVLTSIYEQCRAEWGLETFIRDREVESLGAPVERLLDIEREVDAAFELRELAQSVRQELTDWMRGCGSSTYAVRSSGTQEDLGGASFAGQYESYLDVPPADVPRAICRCFASLFTARAALYRRRKHCAAVGSMAVIVQQMIRSEHAGVVFTRAPGRPDALLIECAPGLGERVVSGDIAPSRYYVDRSSFAVRDCVERHHLDRECIRDVARVALGIERRLDGAQDIEYGVSDGVLFILQARPALTAQSPS